MVERRAPNCENVDSNSGHGGMLAPHIDPSSKQNKATRWSVDTEPVTLSWIFFRCKQLVIQILSWFSRSPRLVSNLSELTHCRSTGYPVSASDLFTCMVSLLGGISEE